jgi:proteasome assembly chaperone (PAC2) family protein
MADEPKLKSPWLVGVWPGMGQVAISAGYYLISKLDMHAIAEFSPRELFDVENVEVKNGLIKAARLPRSRFFAWHDPKGAHDLVIFIGEAQPPIGRHLFCRKLLQFAQELGVERVFTFASMATQMRPEDQSRVFAAATDRETLDDLKKLELQVLEEGQISGLNGVLLGVAAETGLRGGCLLGEIPHIFAQFPFPQGSLAVLNAFRRLTQIEIDLSELAQQAEAMAHQLGEVLNQVEHAIEKSQEEGAEDEDEDEEEGPSFGEPPAEEPRINAQDEQRVEQLFDQARQDRKKAYELKGQLDKLGVFDLYEDRFLDLFKKPTA